MHTHTAAPAPRSPRSLAWLPVFLAMLVVSCVALVGCGGSPSTEGGSGSATEAPPATEAGAPVAETDPAALGAQVYSARCALCHGASGKGDGPASAGLNPKPRDHTDGSYMSTLTDEQVMAVIRDGKGTMPAWGSVLSEPELQAVAAHVRTLAK